MGDQIVPSHITQGKPYSPFYKGDHENDDLPFYSCGRVTHLGSSIARKRPKECNTRP